MARTGSPARSPRRIAAQLVAAGGLVVGLVAAPFGAPAAQADEIRDMQWYLAHLDLPSAWEVTQGAGITVAVLDSGVDATHPDLGDAVAPGIDLTTGGGDGTTVLEPHGTAMAGLIAARGRGPDGVRGVAPAASILPVTVNSPATIAEGFRWATDHGADVINCSCGTEFRDDPEVRDAVAYALGNDVVVITGAGNGGGPGVDFPGGYGGVITVSALSEQDTLTDDSSYGPEVDLAAPADVVTIYPGGEYAEAGGGTSAATAITSGVAALVRAQFPDLDAGNVVNRLISTGRDLGPPGQDDEFGYGRVDPVAALTADVPIVPANPLGSPGATDPGGSPTTQPAETTAQPSTTGPGDPCPTASPAGPAPAGALVVGESDCADTDPGLADGSGSSSALPAVLGGIGIALVLVIGVAVALARRRRGSTAVAP